MRLLGKWTVPLDPKQVVKLFHSGAIVVDVRSANEYANNHIASSINIPLDDLEKNYEQLKDKTILLCCASGARSQIAMGKLNKLGLKNVFDIGGLTKVRKILKI